MDIKIITDSLSRDDLRAIAENQFMDMVKAVVDVSRGVMAIGGELHADEEAVLLEQGSAHKDLWGVNLYPDRDEDEFVEFDSMINLRPSQGNRSRGVIDPEIRKSIISTVDALME